MLDGTRTLISPVFPSIGGEYTMQMRVKLDALSGPRIFEQLGGGLILEWLSGSGALRINLRDEFGNQVIGNRVTPANSVLANNYHTITLSVNLTANPDVVKVWVDGNETGFFIDNESNGQVNRGRQFELIDTTTRGEMRFSQMWLAAATGPDLGDYVDGAWVDGADGLGAPFKRAQADAGGSLIQLGTAPAW